MFVKKLPYIFLAEQENELVFSAEIGYNEFIMGLYMHKTGLPRIQTERIARFCSLCG